MDILNEILQKLGISKVSLAKYLGVSRQMVYNYLESDDINKWPVEKKIKILKLLGIEDVEDIPNIIVTNSYIIEVEKRLNEETAQNREIQELDLRGISKEGQSILNEIMFFLKEKLYDDDTDETYISLKYLFHFIQAMDNMKELNYILAYISKTTAMTPSMEFNFDEDEQMTFESILYSAMCLYNSGTTSKTKITEFHKRFEAEIDQKKEEILSKTQELYTNRAQALKELGYTEINEQNAAEVFEKIAEIQSRKI